MEKAREKEHYQEELYIFHYPVLSLNDGVT